MFISMFKDDMKKILVINVNWLGDVIFSSSVFKALKENYPNSKIVCLAVPRVADVVKSIEGVDDVIIYDEKGIHWSPFGKFALIFRLRKENFDAAFLLHGSMTRALLVFLAGIPLRVGYATKKRGSLLTHSVDLPKNPMHRGDFYLNVIESFGLTIKDRRYELCVSNESLKFAEEILKMHQISDSDFSVILNTGGNWDLKQWPKENFSLLADQLEKRFHAKVIVIGAKKDIDRVDEIIKKSNAKMANLCGKTSFSQLMGLMKKVSLVISADSGPMHIASSVGTKTIGLFGPTRPEITGQRGKEKGCVIFNNIGCNDNPCYYLTCPDNICMKAITVDDVIKKVKETRN